MNATSLAPVKRICQRYGAVIIECTRNALRIAVTSTPTDEMMEALRFVYQGTIETEHWPLAKFEQYAHAADTPDTSDAVQNTASNRVSDVVHTLLRQAVERRASDIHIEPQRNHLAVRLRIDGVLIPLNNQLTCESGALIARLKVLAGMDIAERRLPQDGQFSLTCNNTQAAFRLSTLPVLYGEKIVLRLLQTQADAISLRQLGLSVLQLQQYKSALSKPQGLVLATGPTGSGKTFTLYSGISYLNQANRNLSSVEDPIEIPIAGVNQTQVNLKSGLNFTRVLRALLRQDPDIIMIGEIRDAETADIAVKAAQTGHLVLSTLHTNSTVETLTRLSQMGIPGYMLGPSLKLIIAQRLVRKLCLHCRQRGQVLTHLPTDLWPGTLQTWYATGCEHCFSGYYGCQAIFEFLPINTKLQNAIIAEKTADELLILAKKQGMTTLYQAGLVAVSKGETALEELHRVIDDGHG